MFTVTISAHNYKHNIRNELEEDLLMENKAEAFVNMPDYVLEEFAKKDNYREFHKDCTDSLIKQINDKEKDIRYLKDQCDGVANALEWISHYIDIKRAVDRQNQLIILKDKMIKIYNDLLKRRIEEVIVDIDDIQNKADKKIKKDEEGGDIEEGIERISS